MTNYYLVKSKLFLVFVVISALALSAIPFIKKALAEASDVYVKERMHYIQAALWSHDIKKDIHTICISENLMILQHETLLETGQGLSCSIDTHNRTLALYTPLKTKDAVYCIDTLGFQGLVAKEQSLQGRCSK